ncbi:MAG TPA: DnaJ C-terminal domain-containing protein, partial [Legionellaceae bacterium]|nr:DnaJ C-terminal domain-containing protein [Legionellaceae bacterium]
YRRLARKYHPDLNKEADAEKNFKALGEAYDVLKDPKKRQAYDQMQAQQAHHGYSQQTFDWDQWGQTPSDGQFDADLFASIFGSHVRGGVDLHGKITITLQEAFKGVVKEIQLPDASGNTQKIQVKIPAGVRSDQQIRLAGLGQAGPKGGPNGDLYLTIVVKRDPIFDVVQNDVYLTLPIAPWEAALGATIKVPTLGGQVDLKIPPRSQGGQTLRLKKRGLPGATPGDQYVILKIVIPQPTTPSAIELYQNMAKEMAFNPREHLEARHD